MKLPKKQAAVVRAALEEWRASGLLDEETGKRLLDDLTPLPFDWYRLGRYALWSALTCILIGVAALLGDELFLELISRLFVADGTGAQPVPDPCGGGPVLLGRTAAQENPRNG